jgi:ATP-dependent helicase HrpA
VPDRIPRPEDLPEGSAARSRLDRRPAVTYPPELPVSQARGEIQRALESSQVVVVAGETGSGKTTQLPKICLEAGRGIHGAITLTQPRRIAARSVAARIADELGVRLGDVVGFKVRFDDRSGANPLVRVVTDGILLSELERDPDARRSDTIIIDEAHERSLNVDFLLGCLRRILARRPDLKLIVASATIDVRRFSEHFGGAPVVEVGGRLHPIEVRWRPDPADAERGHVERVLDGIEECVREGPGDVLAFLAGERDILDAADALRRMPSMAGADILPLHARLPSGEQDRVFRPGGARRIVLSTNVAETSVTVPGIRFVVDSGVARIARWSGRSRVLRLPVEPISRASADQRAGRCGRVGPGICIRLWSEDSHAAREAFTPPEILRTDLASVILRMKSLRLGDVGRFPFIDPPGTRAVAEGLETLHELGAIDRREALTPLGRRMSQLPLDPRLARMLLAAVDEGVGAEGAVLAAALSIQDPRERPSAHAALADLAHAAWRDPDGDFMSFLRLWRRWRAESSTRGSSSLRRWCREHYLSHQRLREWTDLHDQVRTMLDERLRMRVPPLAESSDAARVHRAALAGFVSQVGLRTEEGDYRTASGARFAAFPGSALARRGPAWVVAAEVVETSRRFGRVLGKVQGDWVERVAPHLVRRIQSEPHWVRARGQVAAWERVQYGELTVVPRRRVPYGPVNPVEARNIFIQSALVDGDCGLEAPFVRHNRELRARIEAMEAKRRERGLLVEGEAVFAFFDARVPADVHSLPSFERWRRQAEARDPRLLFMRDGDLLAHAPDPELAARFPDSLTAGHGGALALRYALDPGAPSDGVHVQVPLDRLWDTDAARLEWLVPGLLPEKIEALARTLPKALRTRFFPLRDLAVDAASTLPFGEGPLVEALAGYLTTIGATDIRPEMIDAAQLPAHLRMHVEVVGPDGTVIARGDDLAALRRDLAPRRAASRARDVNEAFGDAWPGPDMRTWSIDTLPERLEATLADGRRVVAWPGLADRGDTVRAELFDDPDAAARASARGLRRLYAIARGDELDHHLEYAPGIDDAALACLAATGAGRSTLVAALRLALAGHAFVDGLPAVRDASAFDERADAQAARLPALAAELVRASASIHGQAIEVLRALEGNVPASWAESVADVRTCLARLAPADAVARVPRELLPSLVRWTAALAARARKLRSGGHVRDAALMSQARRWEDELARAEATLAAERGDAEVLAPFRELLEEYRVSLFAQELRTRVPVSDERLARALRSTPRAGSPGRPR